MQSPILEEKKGFQITVLCFHLKEPVKEEQIKLKLSRSEEIREEINETENRKTIEEISEAKSLLFFDIIKSGQL